MRQVTWVVAATVFCASGCGATVADRDTVAPSPTYTGPTSKPTVVPPAPGLVTTRTAVTVLEGDGHGPELCVGAVAASDPPQCGGPPLIGWDWADYPGASRHEGTTTFGDFVVTGTFDGTALTPTRVVPAAEAPASSPDSGPQLSTPCPEPTGGWVVDTSKLSQDDLNAALRAAGHLDDYANAYLDTSRDPRTEAEIEQGDGGDDPGSAVVDVLVTGDPDAASRAVRQVWGGGLCVTRTSTTSRHLTRIQRRTEDVPGWQGSSSGIQHVDVEVVYDDGRLQAWADSTFGPGLVVVGSALLDVP